MPRKGMTLSPEQKQKMIEGRKRAREQSKLQQQTKSNITQSNSVQVNQVTGKSALGQKSYKKFVTGGKLTLKEAIQAKCYECMGMYEDGRYSCEVSNCPLYQYMPYRNKVAPYNKDIDGMFTNK